MQQLCASQRTTSDKKLPLLHSIAGFQANEMGTVIGVRTWGGEIWLSRDNRLVDGGIASAPELGVFGLDGEWLIENHGAEPDIVVDNGPHATFNGEDAQLARGVAELLRQLEAEPVPVPVHPPYPDRSYSGPVTEQCP